MTSVSHQEVEIRHVLETRANELARETGFVQRTRKLTGADFVQSVVFGWLHNSEATLPQLTHAFAARNVSITPSGVSQRFGPEAAALLQGVLSELVQIKCSAPPTQVELLRRFAQVVLEDSSQILLPDELREQWPGYKAQAAALKLHVQWDLLHGTLWGPMLTAGKVSDHRSVLRQRELPPGSLSITDGGYFSIQWLKRQEDRKVFFLTRPRSTTAIFDELGQRLDLRTIGPRQVGHTLSLPVCLGVETRLPVRLIMIRVGEEVVEERLEDLREEARAHGRRVTQEQIELLNWTILVSNAPAELLSVEEVIVLKRARWQIELLFKLWKQYGRIDEWRSKKPWRILCEVYGKLIAMVIEHWFIVEGCWHDPWRSLVKAADVVRTYALDIVEVLMGEMSWQRLCSKMRRAMTNGSRTERRQQHPSQAQLFLDGLDWRLLT